MVARRALGGLRILSLALKHDTVLTCFFIIYNFGRHITWRSVDVLRIFAVCSTDRHEDHPVPVLVLRPVTERFRL